MNIVDLIKDQLTGDMIGKLSSVLGEGEDKTKTAIGAAVPSLLSTLASLASSSGGAEKLISTLRSVDPSPDSYAGKIAHGDGDSVKNKGIDILGSLLGGGGLPALIGSLVKFSGLGATAAKSLLGYLAPLIMSVIASQLKGQFTASNLAGLFADQKSNISRAIPAGLSLADIPGLGVKSAATTVKQTAPAAAEGGLPGWLLPLVGLGLLGLLGWYFLSSPAQEAPAPVPIPSAPVARPVVPPAAKVVDAVTTAMPTAEEVSTALSGVYTKATQALTSVKDVATAEAAVPGLTELSTKLDGVKGLWTRLPDAAKTSIVKVTTDNLGTIKELVAKVLAMPGVADKLKPVLDTVVTKLAGFSS